MARRRRSRQGLTWHYGEGADPERFRSLGDRCLEPRGGLNGVWTWGRLKIRRQERVSCSGISRVLENWRRKRPEIEEARGCLVLDLHCLNIQVGESSSVGELEKEKIRILDEEAHLRLYRGDRNVTVGLHSLHYGQFHSSMGGSYTH